jgi:DNA repair protein RecN (Recombination protein N)
MLSQLSIKNIVLIESCDISLEQGLCVLSGETGAGKSILLDALGLVLGARADTGLIRQGETQGSVTAEFDIAENEQAQQMLKELELEVADSLIIRRTITADGKTRCLVNDQSVTVTALKKLAETLVEIHGQHEQRTLQDASVHRELLDAFGKLTITANQVAAAYAIWKTHSEALTALKAEIEQAMREQDYLKHMRAELSELDPKVGEEEELSSKRTAMMQSEKLFEVLNAAIAELSQGKGAIASLRSAQRALSRSPLTSSGAFTTIMDSLDKAAIEAEEASYALEKAGHDAVYNPEKLDALEERLFALKAASRKYNLPVDELAGLYAQVEGKLSLLTSQEGKLIAIIKEEAAAKIAYAQAAAKLSDARRKSATKLEKAIEAELVPLKMDNTRFRVMITPLPETQWSAHGADSIQFECATNVTKGTKDVAFAPLSKIASGGELSRFMLAMKVALSGIRSASTLIFDEIDSGTGGAVADAIGARLGLLGRQTQVLVVTHLPQVAARGNQHLQVLKEQKAKKITTQVKNLSTAERQEELARMLAGATVTAEARKAAQKLLEQAA